MKHGICSNIHNFSEMYICANPTRDLPFRDPASLQLRYGVGLTYIKTYIPSTSNPAYISRGHHSSIPIHKKNTDEADGFQHTIGLKVTSEPPPSMAGHMTRTGSLSSYPPKQQARSTLFDSVIDNRCTRYTAILGKN
ncbi:hypothetical protein J6590_008619 [Homalodisca vitripennis]|nr:hypothetical protein J6590_008619 [Homalodisca vitripennis]